MAPGKFHVLCVILGTLPYSLVGTPLLRGYSIWIRTSAVRLSSVAFLNCRALSQVMYEYLKKSLKKSLG